MERYLFVIDYQNDFVSGALGFPGAEKLDAACTDSFDKGLHEKALDVLEGFQVKVTGR